MPDWMPKNVDRETQSNLLRAQANAKRGEAALSPRQNTNRDMQAYWYGKDGEAGYRDRMMAEILQNRQRAVQHQSGADQSRRAVLMGLLGNIQR